MVVLAVGIHRGEITLSPRTHHDVKLPRHHIKPRIDHLEDELREIIPPFFLCQKCLDLIADTAFTVAAPSRYTIQEIMR
jgi:hypothetical protein